MSKTSFLGLCDCLSPLLPASLYPHLLAPPTSTDAHAHKDTPTHTQAFEIPSAPLCSLGDGVNPDLKFQSPLSIILIYLHPRTQPEARGPAKPQGQMLEAFIEGKVAGRPPVSTEGPEMPRSEQGDLQTIQAPPCWPAHLFALQVPTAAAAQQFALQGLG